LHTERQNLSLEILGIVTHADEIEDI